jgi:hypothetical protein
MFEKICAPALIYLVFSLTQIIIDAAMGLYNTAGMKVVVAIMITFLLNILCERELTVISWLIVFIPFILMTTIVSILLYVFGLDIAQGKIKKRNEPLYSDISSVPLSSSRPVNPNTPHGLSEYYCYNNPPFETTSSQCQQAPPIGTSSPQYESFSLSQE